MEDNTEVLWVERRKLPTILHRPSHRKLRSKTEWHIGRLMGGKIPLLTLSLLPKPPKEVGGVEVTLFQITRHMTSSQVLEEYEKRDLVPVDPYTLMELGKDLEFADNHPTATVWYERQDGFQGFRDVWYHCCFFSRWFYSEKHKTHLLNHYIELNCDTYGWDAGWWFAGVPK